jgi:hypothetical protein
MKTWDLGRLRRECFRGSIAAQLTIETDASLCTAAVNPAASPVSKFAVPFRPRFGEKSSLSSSLTHSKLHNHEWNRTKACHHVQRARSHVLCPGSGQRRHGLHDAFGYKKTGVSKGKNCFPRLLHRTIAVRELIITSMTLFQPNVDIMIFK